MGDPVVGKMSVQRAAVAISVPSKGGAHADGGADSKWAITDGFAPSVKPDALAQSPPDIARQFLSGVCADRVALHGALDEAFQVSVTLADPEAYKAATTAIRRHLDELSATASKMEAALREKKAPILARLVRAADDLEGKRLDKVLKLQLAKQRVASAQFQDDKELKAEAKDLEQQVRAATAELNEALNDLRAEVQDE